VVWPKKTIVSISLGNVIIKVHIIILTAPPNFISESGTVSATPPVLSMRCGQNYEGVSLSGFALVQITCPEFNGTDTTLRAYKDGVEIDGFTGTLRFGPGPNPPITDDIFGTYTFSTENECGRDIEMSRIIRQGQYLLEQ